MVLTNKDKIRNEGTDRFEVSRERRSRDLGRRGLRSNQEMGEWRA